MEKQNREMSVRQKDDSDLGVRLTYFALGGAIGALVALLFAPKAGHELRGDIADATRKGIDRTRETASQIGDRAGEYYGQARERAGEIASNVYTQAAQKAGELGDQAREMVRSRTDQISAAIEAGKQAYNEEKQRTAPKEIEQ